MTYTALPDRAVFLTECIEQDGSIWRGARHPRNDHHQEHAQERGQPAQVLCVSGNALAVTFQRLPFVAPCA